LLLAKLEKLEKDFLNILKRFATRVGSIAPTVNLFACPKSTYISGFGPDAYEFLFVNHPQLPMPWIKKVILVHSPEAIRLDPSFFFEGFLV